MTIPKSPECAKMFLSARTLSGPSSHRAVPRFLRKAFSPISILNKLHHQVVVPAQREHLFPLIQLPDAHGLVEAAGGEAFAVRVESDATDARGVAPQGMDQVAVA